MRFEYTYGPDKATEWRPVVGYVDTYEVSDLGHVRRITTSRQGRAGMIMAAHIDPNVGYPRVSLSRGGKCVSHLLHKIVAEAFHGVRPIGMEINHIDFNKRNPSASNLEYVSSSQNQIHAYQSGVVASRGISKPIAKLNDEKARLIFQSSEPGRVVAERFGVSVQTVCDIRKRRSWKHATEEVAA